MLIENKKYDITCLWISMTLARLLEHSSLAVGVNMSYLLQKSELKSNNNSGSIHFSIPRYCEVYEVLLFISVAL